MAKWKGYIRDTAQAGAGAQKPYEQVAWLRLPSLPSTDASPLVHTYDYRAREGLLMSKLAP